MKPIDTTSPEAVALNAALRLHSQMLYNENQPEYNGTKAAFDNLYKQLFVIANEDVSLDVEPETVVIETFYDYQVEIKLGQRNPDWYLTGIV